MHDFIYISDVHYGKQPISRKDDYNKSILNKLEEVLIACKDMDCPLIIGGDLFDSPKIKMGDLIAIMNLFESFQSTQIYLLHGNDSHDGTKEDSPINILTKLPNIRWSKGITDFQIINGLQFIFCEYGESNEVMESKMEFNQYPYILLTHDTIVQNTIPFEHKLISEFKTQAILIMLAHYHPRQGIITRPDGKQFVGIGALARRKRITHDMNRTPSYAYIKYECNKFQIKEYPLTCLKDCWTAKEFQDHSTDIDLDIERSIEIMKEETKNSPINIPIEDMLKEYAKRTNLGEDILNFIIERMFRK